LKIIPPANLILSIFRCGDLSTLKAMFKRLPNVIVLEDDLGVIQNQYGTQVVKLDDKSGPLEPPKNANGEFTVIISKWFKYQVDSTAYDRVKRSRYKTREDKIRKEEKRGEQNSLPAFVLEWQKKTAGERQAGAAQIAEGLKGFGLGFRQADDMYKKIMGEDKNGTVRGKSIFEQAAERKRAQGFEKPRDLHSKPNAGEIFARIRDLPKVQPET
jgi:hypothetical protein